MYIKYLLKTNGNKSSNLMRDKSTLVWVLAVICKWIRHTHTRGL